MKAFNTNTNKIMFSNQSTEFALEAPCRVVESIKADKLDNRFLVGSCQVVVGASRSSSGEQNHFADMNHLYVMRFHSEVNELGLDMALPHEPGPIQAIAACPTDASLALTCTERSPQATLWKIPNAIIDNGYNHNHHEDHHHLHDNNSSSCIMKPLVTLLPPPLSASSSASSSSSADLADVVWRDDGHEDVSSSSMTTGDVLTLDKCGTLTRWDISSATATPVRTVRSKSASRANNNNASSIVPPPRVAWDPHANNGDAVAVTRGRAVDILDWRVGVSDNSTIISAVPVGTVASFSAHGAGVIDLDYNPNKPYVLATSGQDGLLKFWDLRSARRPLLVCTGGHSHWAWNVQYNPFHDQLVLSTGTDSMVNLWRVSSVSSAPLLTLNDDDDDEDDDDNNHHAANNRNEGGGGGGGGNHSGNHHHHHGGRMGKDENKDNNNNNNRNLSETAAHNVLVGSMEHTADACYGAAWGAADAWIYVTVGYDGKVVLSHVPSKEKYKILL